MAAMSALLTAADPGGWSRPHVEARVRAVNVGNGLAWRDGTRPFRGKSVCLQLPDLLVLPPSHYGGEWMNWRMNELRFVQRMIFFFCIAFPAATGMKVPGAP